MIGVDQASPSLDRLLFNTDLNRFYFGTFSIAGRFSAFTLIFYARFSKGSGIRELSNDLINC